MPPSAQYQITQPVYDNQNFIQNRFDGGLDTVSGDTQIPQNAYNWLVNGRSRFGYVEPIKKHELIPGLPYGIKQGLVAVGNVLVAFVEGFAYYRIEGSDEWMQVPNFQMDALVSEYYFETVPASYLNFKRTPNPDIFSPLKSAVNFKINGTPAGIVVQDTINQPWIIFFDQAGTSTGMFTSRVLKNFKQWNNTQISTEDREYVPIGKQMLYLEAGILMIVAPDGKSVYRSITGRPLDFMINVDTEGNKLADENLGGAATVSFACDFDTITCLARVNTIDAFLYATEMNIKVVTLNYNSTIFGEPTFSIQARIEAGVVNHKSIVEILGGYAFINYNSITSFDAVQQLKFQGKNSIFSLEVSRLMENKKQTRCAATVWNNYCLFNVDTTWGNLIAAYDLLLQKWVSFDITDVTKVRHFATVRTDTFTYLYALTMNGEVYRMYSGDTRYIAKLKTRGHIKGETAAEHKAQHFRPFFAGGTFPGTVRLLEYGDDQTSNIPIEKVLPESLSGIAYPVRPPVIPAMVNRSDTPSFVMKDGLAGKKISYIIEWDTDARLVEFELITSAQKSSASLKEKNLVTKNTYGNNS
jgi:hypothetical protein